MHKFSQYDFSTKRFFAPCIVLSVVCFQSDFFVARDVRNVKSSLSKIVLQNADKNYDLLHAVDSD